MSKKSSELTLGTSVKLAILTTEGEIQEKWSIKTNILDEEAILFLISLTASNIVLKHMV